MKHIKEFFVNSFFTYFAIELVEEVLEELIVMEISSLILKFLSTFLFVSISTGAKMGFKAFIKRITYKEGNDKVAKIKQIFSWLFANKCTLLGIAGGALTVVSGVGIIDVESLPELVIAGHNITPLLYYSVLGILTIICSFFPETIEKYKERIAEVKAEKEAKAIEKEAEKELANEEKLANQTQAEQEKAQAKAEAEQKAQEEKAQAEAEHRAKVEAAKAKLLEEKAKANNETVSQ